MAGRQGAAHASARRRQELRGSPSAGGSSGYNEALRPPSRGNTAGTGPAPARPGVSWADPDQPEESVPKYEPLAPAAVRAFLEGFGYEASDSDSWRRLPGQSDTTAPALTISVPDREERQGHTMYTINCIITDAPTRVRRAEWNVQKRLASLREDLHDVLKALLGSAYSTHFGNTPFALRGGLPGTTARLNAWFGSCASAVNSGLVPPSGVALVLHYLEVPDASDLTDVPSDAPRISTGGAAEGGVVMGPPTTGSTPSQASSPSSLGRQAAAGGLGISSPSVAGTSGSAAGVAASTVGIAAAAGSLTSAAAAAGQAGLSSGTAISAAPAPAVSSQGLVFNRPPAEAGVFPSSGRSSAPAAAPDPALAAVDADGIDLQLSFDGADGTHRLQQSSGPGPGRSLIA